MKYLELSGIGFSYGANEPEIFRDFSFFAEKGECVSIRGDNGSGKTTLLRIINGLSFPDRGRYFFDGEEISQKFLKNTQNAKRFHKRIGYLFQNPDIMLFNAKVFDEIAFGPRQMGLDEATVKERTDECMRLFGLEALADKAPYHLSGGQKKKVAFAAVLSLAPEVIVMDEPFAGLDAKTTETVISLLYRLKESGKTLLLATHNTAIPKKLVDRDICLSG